MATGVRGKERIGSESFTAAKPHADPHPLPGPLAAVRLEYDFKLNEIEILRHIPNSFCTIDRHQNKRQSNIQPNALVLADNLFALHNMLQNGERPKLIYFDPPYATGMEFQTRQLERAYKDVLAPAAYIEFIRRRLVLMREILADDGSIYIHIGHQMIGHMKTLMDEIFGAKNFRNLIVRRKCSSKNSTRKQLPNLHDYLLFYTKTSDFVWNQPTELPSDDWLDKEYDKVDARGRHKLVPIHAPGTRQGETGKAWRGMLPPPGKHWQYTPAKLDELDAAGEIYWSKTNNPRRKTYLTPDKRRPLTDYWANFRDAHHQSIQITGYPTEKNLDMMKVIVAASSNPGDLILDPFSGSGTTLQAAHDLQRKWIGIDESFAATKAALRRFRHGLSKMGDYVQRPSDSGMLFDDLPATKPVEHLTFPGEFSFVVDSELLATTNVEQIYELAAT